MGVNQGLSEASNIFDVYQDLRGFIWIGSLDGLNRFDGTTVTRYFPNPEDSCAIVGENIQSTFFEEDSSALWFTTSMAIIRYDWKMDCFKHYHIYIGKDSLDGYNAFHLDQDHNIWLIGSSALHTYIYTFNTISCQYKLVHKLTKPAHRAIAITDHLGNVASIWSYWINAIGVETFNVDNQIKSQASRILWDSTSQINPAIKQIIGQGDSVLWVLSANTLLKYNHQKNTTHSISISQGTAQSLYLLDNITLLIGFLGAGIWEFNIRQGTFTNHYLHLPEDGLSLLSNNADRISKDKSGNLWVGSRGFGLSYSHPQKKKFNSFYPHLDQSNIQDFFPNSFYSEKHGAVGCATRSSGLYTFQRTSFDRQEISRVPNLDPKSLLGVLSNVIRDRQDRYWLITYSGLSVFDPKTGKIIHVNRKPQFALAGIPWLKDKVLISGNGLYETEGDMDKGFKLVWHRVVSDSVQYFPIWLDGKGRLWLNQAQKELFVLDTSDFHILKAISNLGNPSQFAESNDGSTIWSNGENGLYEIDGDSLYIRKIHNQQSGFPSGSFNSIVVDLDNRLWLTRNEGILMYDPDNGNTQTYAQDDGLPPLQFTRASYRFDDGEIWLGFTQGITRFYPDSIHDLQISAIPQITEILVNDHVRVKELVCDQTGSVNIPFIKELTFNYKNNTLAFRVHALEYSSPQHNKVEYQMIGMDDELIETSTGNLVRYPNMEPGNYRFVVYALNSDGVKNLQAHELLIHITPPYYKTWWFITLMILLGGSLLAYIVYLRFSKTLELQRVRLKLYENLHDDVGSRLTAIVLSAEDLERNENIHHPKIQSISKIAKSIVGNMRRLVWAIDPENDKMSNLIQKITHDKSLILDEKITFQVKVDDQLKNIIVPGEIRYQVISICNEAFNNISKYAKATAVTVSLSKENRNYHLTIQDNGIGFDTSTAVQNALTGSGYGLNNMKRRASRVKGKLELYSKPGEGTRIEADFPY